MTKGLRKISELSFGDGIVFLGKKSKIVAQSEQPLK